MTQKNLKLPQSLVQEISKPSAMSSETLFIWESDVTGYEVRGGDTFGLQYSIYLNVVWILLASIVFVLKHINTYSAVAINRFSISSSQPQKIQ